MSNSWFSVHRQIWDNPISKKPNYLAVWIYLVSHANYADKEYILNNEKILIKRGSFVGSIKKIAEHFKMPRTTVGRIINYFKVDSMLDIKSTSKYSLFTILKYEEFQKVDIKRTSNGHQTDTTNKDNKDNNKIYAQNFEEFWKLYPRKIGKGKARDKYKSLVSKHELIITALNKQIPCWKDIEVKYIPHPATWLNQERWEDEIEVQHKNKIEINLMK